MECVEKYSSQAAKILRFGIVNPLPCIDPLTAHDAETNLVLRQIFEQPFALAAGAEQVKPRLAVDVEALDEPSERSIRFRLRDGARFSDGSPVTLEDVASSLSRTTALRRQASVSVAGPWIEVRSRLGDRRLDFVLAHSQCSIVRHDRGQVLGCGPWMLHPESRPDEVRLIRNPHYLPPPPIDEIHFSVYPVDEDGRPTALIDALASGLVNVSLVVPRDEMIGLSGVRKWFSPALATGLLFLQCQRPALADQRVRRALTYAIDRYEIAKSCYKNPLAYMATSPLPRPLGEDEQDGLDFDLSRARTLLDELGPARPRRLSMNLVWAPRPYLPAPIDTARLIRSQLARVDIEVDIRSPDDSTAFFERIVAGDDDLVLGGWIGETPDPCDFLDAILASDHITSLDNLILHANHAHLRSDNMDQALMEYRRYRDRQALEQVMTSLRDEASVIPLIYGTTTMASSFRVQGLQRSPLPFYPLTEVDLMQ